jgi:hypothetical protein
MLQGRPPTFVEHVRGTFDQQVLRRLRAYLNEAHADFAARAASAREKAAVARGETPDTVRLDPAWFDVFRERTTQLLDTLAPYMWVIYPPQVRVVRQLDHSVPWHQDIGYQKLLGKRAHAALITCFIPLDEDPHRRCTIQFADDAEGVGELEHKPLAGFGAGLDSTRFEHVRHFDLSLGDCLLFGHLAPHRTHVPPGCQVERRSLEFRLVRPEDAVAEKDYFDVRSGMFVRTDGSTRSKPT